MKRVCIGNTVEEVCEYIEFFSKDGKRNINIWKGKERNEKSFEKFKLDNFTKGRTYVFNEYGTTGIHHQMVIDDNGYKDVWQKGCVVDCCFLSEKMVRKLKLEQII